MPDIGGPKPWIIRAEFAVKPPRPLPLTLLTKASLGNQNAVFGIVIPALLES